MQLQPYLRLMEAHEVQTQYFFCFVNEKHRFGDDTFQILNRLCTDCDAFNPDVALRGPKDLDEAQLLEACNTAYKRLQDIQS